MPETFLLDGAAGAIECALSAPPTPRAIAVVGHPHPLYGGSMSNKVVTTLARSLLDHGHAVARFNFRGVGKSAGTHDEGRGETDDFGQVVGALQARYPGLPLTLGGFSFGGAVALAASERVAVDRMLLVAPAFSRMPLLAVDGGKPPVNTLLLHGERDETVPLTESFAWARPRDFAVWVVPGADHFFHLRLHHVKRAVAALCET
jgi:hypothetical protein